MLANRTLLSLLPAVVGRLLVLFLARIYGRTFFWRVRPHSKSVALSDLVKVGSQTIASWFVEFLQNYVSFVAIADSCTSFIDGTGQIIEPAGRIAALVVLYVLDYGNLAEFPKE